MGFNVSLQKLLCVFYLKNGYKRYYEYLFSEREIRDYIMGFNLMQVYRSNYDFYFKGGL